MALKWIEGFEGFGVTPGSAPQPSGVLVRKGYTASDESHFDIEDGHWNGYCLEMDGSGDYLHSPTFSLTSGSASWTTAIGFSIQFSNLGTYKFLSLYSDDPNESINLRLRADGEIDVYRVDTFLGTTSGAAIEANIWCHVELKVYAHNTSGTVDIRVNESSVLSLSGIDTAVGSYLHTSWRLWSLDSGSVKFDDVYFLDGSGSKNNALLGPKQVKTIFPNAVGDDSGWTSTAGSNYECVDENPVDDAVSYVSSNVSGQFDLYNYEDISDVQMPEGIVGVQVNTDCARTGSLTFGFLAFVKGTDFASLPPAYGSNPTQHPLYTVDHSDFQTKSSIMEYDADDNDWTLEALNATQFGVKMG